MTGEAAAALPREASLQALPDLVLVVHRSGTVLTCLGGRHLGDASMPQDLAGRALDTIWPEPIASRLMQLVRRVLKTREAVRHPCSDGNRTYEARVSVQARDQALLVFRDLTGAAEGPDERGAVADGEPPALPSREVFLARSEALLAHACLAEQRAALFLVHLGDLESVALTLGLDQSERLVRLAGDRLARLTREDGAGTQTPRVGRLANELLALRLDAIPNRDAVARIAERMQSVLKEPLVDGGREIAIEPAIGIALLPEDGTELPDLLEHARAALLEARRGTDPVVFYSDTARLKALTRPDLERELTWALEGHQFALHFQPRIDLASGRVVALESLLRWIHPVRGNVGLAEFLPLTEVTRLAEPLGRWVLDEAGRAAAALSQAGFGAVQVSVNVGRRHFASLELARDVRAALEAGRIDPRVLELEVTERMLTRAGGAVDTLRDLRSLGVRVLVDEFGSGYFSLSELRDMPVDAVKMPRRFVSHIDTDPRARSICAAAIAIARTFGLTAVAVGIESQRQQELLLADGCAEGQGFLFAPPQPLELVLRTLRAADLRAPT
jgi:predicted signal transduction protein with EAL and GGDEF domain